MLPLLCVALHTLLLSTLRELFPPLCVALILYCCQPWVRVILPPMSLALHTLLSTLRVLLPPLCLALRFLTCIVGGQGFCRASIALLARPHPLVPFAPTHLPCFTAFCAYTGSLIRLQVIMHCNLTGSLVRVNTGSLVQVRLGMLAHSTSQTCAYARTNDHVSIGNA